MDKEEEQGIVSFSERNELTFVYIGQINCVLVIIQTLIGKGTGFWATLRDWRENAALYYGSLCFSVNHTFNPYCFMIFLQIQSGHRSQTLQSK